MQFSYKESHPATEGRVYITYYTDPLCCWSWGFEPQWRRLRYEFQNYIQYQYKMGGLLANWDSFQDPMNNITRPAHMGPLWMEAQHISGMPIDNKIWISEEAPTSSSYPACIAVKCVQMQSDKLAEIYLRKLREAVMMERKNISKKEVLFSVADQLKTIAPDSFNKDLFIAHFEGREGKDAFRMDLQEVQYQNIGRFPTLVIKNAEGQGVMIAGYRPYSVLLDAMRTIDPQLPEVFDIHPHAYESYWGGEVLQRELEIAMAEQ